MELHVHPAKSSDLNSIEHVWGVMKGDVQRSAPMDEEELCAAVNKSWQVRTKAPGADEYLGSLFNSMHDRIDAVIQNSGSRSGY